MPDADDQVTEETVVGHAGAEGVPLTPAQVGYVFCPKAMIMQLI